MQNGLYVSLSAQVALEKRLNTIADNVANVNTVGFRATNVKFADVVTGLSNKALTFTSTGDTFIPDLKGELTQTGNPFDFAIQGDGWFAIDTPAGQVMTKDGRFSMLDTGDLVTLEGYPVLDAGGAAIQLDPARGSPVAGADGTLRQNGQLVGSLGLWQFEPGQNPERFGNSGLLPNGTAQPVTDRRDIGVTQGFVENSNVNAMTEMTRLIQVQRAFDNITALMRDSESTMQEAIKTLGSS